MPKPGSAPKAAERRQHQGSDRKTTLVVVPRSDFVPPPVPKGLLAPTVAGWDAYWRSDVGSAATEVDMGAVETYFVTLDEWRRCTAAVRKPGARFVEGSMKQPRMNPLADRADRLAGLLPRLAAEIGLSPLARSKLVIEAGNATKTMEELSRDADRAAEDIYDSRAALLQSAEDEGRAATPE